jgi:aspartyl-tRNA(Asn)/glutamyl-tRNA(Gln) amidotransferase subunit A
MCIGASNVAPAIADVLNGESISTYADDLMCLANFAGTPSITIPYCKVGGLPLGLNFNCKKFEDQKLLNIAYTFEQLFEEMGHNE